MSYCKIIFVVCFVLSMLFPADSLLAQNRVVVKARVFSPGTISTIAGTTLDGALGIGGDGSLAKDAIISRPWDIDTDAAGNIYIADQGNHRIRKINISTGIITTVAGNESRGYTGDGGLATEASLFNVRGLSVTDSGDIYIAQYQNNVIRKVDGATGIITTVAGDGFRGGGSGTDADFGRYAGDGGLATEASLNRVEGVFVDKAGNIFIPDALNQRIRKVDGATGIITTVAGDGVSPGLGNGRYAGDGGPATEAGLQFPHRVAVDAVGNIYIADQGNNRIRKVDAQTGVITTVAGNGSNVYSGDGGPATEAGVVCQDVDVDGAGNLYISSGFSQHHRVRMVDAQTGIITTIAGNGVAGYSGDDGPAIKAQLYRPMATHVDQAGNIYIADMWNNRIRKITKPTPSSGLRLELARSSAGRANNYTWAGTVGADGQVEIQVEVNAQQFLYRGATGYYSARLVDPSTGDVVAQWHSIPLNGGTEITLELPVGLGSRVQGHRLLNAVPLILGGNQPNPFNPATTISYTLLEPADVTLSIYNALGQQVRNLVQSQQSAGQYRVVWDGKDAIGKSVASGVYFYRLMSSGHSETKRMLLMK